MFWVTLDQGWVINGRTNATGHGAVPADIRMSYKDPSAMLFEAIFNGDSSKVKQLINSGLNKNMVLHNPARYDGASVLGTAAYEGHFDIVTCLVEAGCFVNFTDPCLGRNALHWACKGNQYQIAKYLIQKRINVNLADKDRITPLIQASISRNIDLTKLLIENGADVHAMDKHKCSALHYACVHGDVNLIETLILNGCIPNNHSVIGKGTPLKSIVLRKDSRNVQLLLSAGYDVSGEHWLKELTCLADIDDPLTKECVDRYTNPPSLVMLCRNKTRTQMGGVNIRTKIHDLELPTLIKRFLLLEI